MQEKEILVLKLKYGFNGGSGAHNKDVSRCLLRQVPIRPTLRRRISSFLSDSLFRPGFTPRLSPDSRLFNIYLFVFILQLLASAIIITFPIFFLSLRDLKLQLHFFLFRGKIMRKLNLLGFVVSIWGYNYKS